MLDRIVASGINAAEKTLDRAPAQEEKRSFGYHSARFVVSLIWGVMTFLVTALAFYAMWAHVSLDALEKLIDIEVTPAFGIFAIAISLLMAGITFVIPFLRKKGTFTRSCGIVLLGDGLWWLYIFFTL